MLKRSKNPKQNTGYKNITIQKIAQSKPPYRLAVMVSNTIEGHFYRKSFSINKYGLKEAMRRAITQLYQWHGKEVNTTVLENIDLTKAEAWLAKNDMPKTKETNTGFQAVRIIYNGYGWYVVSTWSDPKTKKQKVKYVSLQKHEYIDALKMLVELRRSILGLPKIEITDNDAVKGLQWLEAHLQASDRAKT